MARSESAWEVALAAATEGLSDQGRRERERHARRLNGWCVKREIEPRRITSGQLNAYLRSLSGADRQLRTKARSAIRAVLRHLDPKVAARAAGLGNCTLLINAYTGTPAGALLDHFFRAGGKQVAVRKAGLTRLLAWCSEIGVEPTGVYPADLIQFREWLKEINAHRPHTVGIARMFVTLRYSELGRDILQEQHSTHRPLLIETASPLTPRFCLDENL